jgi:hypothetical protein
MKVQIPQERQELIAVVTKAERTVEPVKDLLPAAAGPAVSGG